LTTKLSKLHTMRRVLRIGRIALIAVPWAAMGFAAEGTLESTLAKIDQTAASFKDLTADLSRTHHTAVINEDTVDSGEILIKRIRPHELLMRFDIVRPDPRQIAVDSHRAGSISPKARPFRFTISANIRN